MPSFALKPIPEITGVQRVYKLVINNECEWDVFFAEQIEGNNSKDLMKIQSILTQYSSLMRLPKGKFRDITPHKDRTKEFECKAGLLRVYLFKASNGSIIVFGGLKGNQVTDIKRFRGIKRKYVEACG